MLPFEKGAYYAALIPVKTSYGMLL